MVGEQFLINELAKMAGVSVRTIRYYIDEGLLPSPASMGRYSVYDTEYLNHIRLIQKMKELYLPLREIRQRLENLTPAEIEDQLELLTEGQERLNFLKPGAPSKPDQVKETNSALDYITHLRNTQRSTGIREPKNLSSPAPQSRFEDWTKQMMQEPQNQASPATPGPDLNGPLTPERLQQRLQPERLADQQPSPANRGGENWRRITLAAGVELHIRDGLTNDEIGQVERLIEAVKAIYSTKSKKEGSND